MRKSEPTGYIFWFEWAERMSKRYKQIKCKCCGKYHIWKKKNNYVNNKLAG
jgi:hypothetical protein